MLSLETDVREDCKNNVKDKSPGFVSGSATKPVSYDTYSTDTSSQFSVDIVDVAPTNREFGEVGNTGCGFFKGGILNWKGFWLKINKSKINDWTLRIGEISRTFFVIDILW